MLALLCVSAAAAQAKPPAATALVLAKGDFPDGAVVTSVSSKIDATFAVSGIPLSSAYTRRFRDVQVGSLRLPQVISSSFVTTPTVAAELLGELGRITYPGSGRKTLMDAMRAGAGAGDVTPSFIRGRPLKLADDAVEFVVRLTQRGGPAIDLQEIWIRQGSAISAVAAIAPAHELSLGQGFQIAKLAAAHMKS